MDRLILDFEKNEITIETDNQVGTEIVSDLSEKKADVYKLLGYETISVQPMIDAINALMNGKITKEDFLKFGEEWTKDE